MSVGLNIFSIIVLLISISSLVIGLLLFLSNDVIEPVEKCPNYSKCNLETSLLINSAKIKKNKIESNGYIGKGIITDNANSKSTNINQLISTSTNKLITVNDNLNVKNIYARFLQSDIKLSDNQNIKNLFINNLNYNINNLTVTSSTQILIDKVTVILNVKPVEDCNIILTFPNDFYNNSYYNIIIYNNIQTTDFKVNISIIQPSSYSFFNLNNSTECLLNCNLLSFNTNIYNWYNYNFNVDKFEKKIYYSYEKKVEENKKQLTKIINVDIDTNPNIYINNKYDIQLSTLSSNDIYYYFFVFNNTNDNNNKIVNIIASNTLIPNSIYNLKLQVSKGNLVNGNEIIFTYPNNWFLRSGFLNQYDTQCTSSTCSINIAKLLANINYEANIQIIIDVNSRILLNVETSNNYKSITSDNIFSNNISSEIMTPKNSKLQLVKQCYKSGNWHLRKLSDNISNITDYKICKPDDTNQKTGLYCEIFLNAPNSTTFYDSIKNLCIINDDPTTSGTTIRIYLYRIFSPYNYKGINFQIIIFFITNSGNAKIQLYNNSGKTIFVTLKFKDSSTRVIQSVNNESSFIISDGSTTIYNVCVLNFNFISDNDLYIYSTDLN